MLFKLLLTVLLLSCDIIVESRITLKQCPPYSASKFPPHRVSSGVTASPGDYPAFVEVRFFYHHDIRALCGGTILSPKQIITAAHCVEDPSESVYVLPTSVMVDDIRENGIKVDKICRSKLYKRIGKGRATNDIAILKLSKNIQFNKTAQAASLIDSLSYLKEQAYAVGLGAVCVDGLGFPKTTSNLQALPVMNTQCKKEDQHESTVCFEANSALNQGDTCLGDSGGGIFVKNNGKHILVALTSYGSKVCEPNHKDKSVNAHIYNLRSEINSLMRECD